jgi:hypothetical protein
MNPKDPRPAFPPREWTLILEQSTQQGYYSRTFKGPSMDGPGPIDVIEKEPIMALLAEKDAQLAEAVEVISEVALLWFHADDLRRMKCGCQGCDINDILNPLGPDGHGVYCVYSKAHTALAKLKPLAGKEGE